ncbi:MAG: CbtB domain-containing protein [Pseudonocardia sp.]|jgi:hypothetical protein
MTSPAITGARPVPVSQSLPWLLGTLLFGLAVYYAVGIDEGATALLGNTGLLHEMVHDARHLLGFPCH